MVFPLYCDWTSNKTSEKQFTLKVLKAHAVSPPALSPSFDCSPYTLWFRFPPFSLPRLVDNIRRQCSFLPLVCYSGDLLPRRDVSATCLRLRQWPATPGVGDLLPAVTHLSSFNIQDSLTCTSVHQLSLSVAYEILGYTGSRQLSQMLLAIIFFHISEYFLAVVIHGRSSVTLKSLLISRHYLLAMIFSFLEYFVEITLSPELKEHWVISDLGLALVVIGEVIRKMGILTAGKAFTHLIRTYPDDQHQLVTHGIYRYIRHPGYCGFLIWSIGTQIMLCNPLSTIGFAVVVWHFFAKRIPYEEFFLRQFFGAQYEEYAQRVVSGVPFVK
ncbi:hypothetical protein RJT34_20124 [Clitoria ternatea]|uniref:Protein-S-isoprenylcysteine O-methyltransferase n=1 Tax=Clitoria ternatea TaxID=43366 RepID=A0AAN9ISA6_CLITE